jgi:hypothetical protein
MYVGVCVKNFIVNSVSNSMKILYSKFQLLGKLFMNVFSSENKNGPEIKMFCKKFIYYDRY